MEKEERLGSAKRFLARYGSKPKHKFAQIEKEQRKKHLCPYCNALRVKRVAVGIWHCRKCNAKFTGKAYTISKTITFEKPAEEKFERKTEEKVKEGLREEKIEKSDEIEKVTEEVA